MPIPLPSAILPQLKSAHLEAVATWLLEEHYATEDDLVRPTDDNYTHGTTTFGRQRNRILAEWRSKKHQWLDVVNSKNDIVFSINAVPCRFSCDDPQNPSKSAVVSANRFQQDFFESNANAEACRFCFVIDRGIGIESEPRVEFLGFTAADTVACRWVSDAVRYLRVEGDAPLAKPVDIAKPQVAPKRRDEGDGDAQEVV